MEENDTGVGKKKRDELFSKVVRAGKRTYFIDVKSSIEKRLYLTVTESKKVYDSDDKHHYEKHKIFLCKEDFSKFVSGLEEAMLYVETNDTTPNPKRYRKDYNEYSKQNIESVENK